MKQPRTISKTFLFFLGMSLIIWLLITLSKEYVTQVSLNVSYDSLPQDKLLQKEPVDELKIIAKGTGFKILSTRFFNHSVRFKTNNLLKKENGVSYLLPANQKIHVQQQLVKGLQLEAFLKDSIFLEIGSLVSKKVPVISSININYQHGFNALKPVEISPDSILISGTNTQVKQIRSLALAPINLENVHANFSHKADVLTPVNVPNIKYSVKAVVVKGLVEKFTEGNFTIPFEIKNIPSNLNLATFPKEVKVVFKVDLPRFQNVSANSFAVDCDYEVSVKNGFNYLIPKISLQPDFVTNVKIIPSKIEYLIQK